MRISLELHGQLRLLVGCLGEKSNNNWWSTSFFDSSSRFFVEPVFARTKRLAQYNGVRGAAQRLHDEQIGLGNVFHLFRLPEEMEQDLQQFIISASEQWFTVLESKETALSALRNLSGEAISAVSAGPQLVGSLEEITHSSGAKSLAQYYLAAFEQGVRTFPYFMN